MIEQPRILRATIRESEWIVGKPYQTRGEAEQKVVQIKSVEHPQATWIGEYRIEEEIQGFVIYAKMVKRA